MLEVEMKINVTKHFIVQPNQGGRCVLGTSKIYAKPISSESESSMHNK